MTPTCPVTVYPPTSTRREVNDKHYREEACGQPVERDGLCARHADDRDRLRGKP